VRIEAREAQVADRQRGESLEHVRWAQLALLNPLEQAFELFPECHGNECKLGPWA